MGKQWKLTDFIFLGSKVTVNGDCSHKVKIRLLLGIKAMINLGSILKCRDISVPTAISITKAFVFPVGRYECENWTTKKPEPQRIECSGAVVLKWTLESLLYC